MIVNKKWGLIQLFFKEELSHIIVIRNVILYVAEFKTLLRNTINV